MINIGQKLEKNDDCVYCSRLFLTEEGKIYYLQTKYRNDEFGGKFPTKRVDLHALAVTMMVRMVSPVLPGSFAAF